MPIISAVGLFYCDKLEETPNEKVVNMSKLTKSHFKIGVSRKWSIRGEGVKMSKNGPRV